MKLGLGTAALGRPQYINIRFQTGGKSNLETFKKNSFSVLETAYNKGVSISIQLLVMVWQKHW
tara:strand:- start:108 stop:296 length:189 start_codon:yes stop_codon:yes gene_type:complete